MNARARVKYTSRNMAFHTSFVFLSFRPFALLIEIVCGALEGCIIHCAARVTVQQNREAGRFHLEFRHRLSVASGNWLFLRAAAWSKRQPDRTPHAHSICLWPAMTLLISTRHICRSSCTWMSDAVPCWRNG
jgi:hypothetical protein